MKLFLACTAMVVVCACNDVAHSNALSDAAVDARTSTMDMGTGMPTDAGPGDDLPRWLRDSGPPPVADCSGGPLATPVVGCAPAVLPSTGNMYDDCVARINQIRATCQCLAPLARWNDGETCADSMAAYAGEHPTDPHGAAHMGLCPYGDAQNVAYAFNVENMIDRSLQIMWDEGPENGDGNEHGHYENMSNTDHAKVACGYFITDTRTYAVQNFSD